MSPVLSEGYLDAGRRQVTVLFTDMVGFTSFSERSGEERHVSRPELRRILATHGRAIQKGQNPP